MKSTDKSVQQQALTAGQASKSAEQPASSTREKRADHGSVQGDAAGKAEQPVGLTGDRLHQPKDTSEYSGPAPAQLETSQPDLDAQKLVHVDSSTLPASSQASTRTSTFSLREAANRTSTCSALPSEGPRT